MLKKDKKRNICMTDYLLDYSVSVSIPAFSSANNDRLYWGLKAVLKSLK